MAVNDILRRFFPGYDPNLYAPNWMPAEEAKRAAVAEQMERDRLMLQADPLVHSTLPSNANRTMAQKWLDSMGYNLQSGMPQQPAAPSPAGFLGTLNPLPQPGFEAPEFDLDEMRTRALLEQELSKPTPLEQARLLPATPGDRFGPSTLERLSPQQPMLPSAPPAPPNLPPMQSSGPDLAEAITRGPQFNPQQQTALQQGEDIIEQIRRRNAQHEQGIFGAPEPVDPNSPLGQFLGASRAAPGAGMTMGAYGQLSPEAQAFVTRWSSGFGERPNALEELIKERGGAITSTGDTVPRGLKLPGVRSMPMGLGDQFGTIDSTGVYRNLPERTEEEKTAAANIAEENLRKKGYVKGPLGWAPPEVAEARMLAQGPAAPTAIDPARIKANDEAIQEMEARRHVNQDRDGDGTPDWRQALTARGQRKGEARRFRMAGMNPSMAELLAGGGGQGSDLFNAAVFGPGYVLENRKIDAQMNAIDKQIDAANKRGDQQRAHELEIKRQELEQQRTAMEMELEQRRRELEQRRLEGAENRQSAERIAGMEQQGREKVADIGAQAQVKAAEAQSAGKNPNTIIEAAKSKDPATSRIARDQLGMTPEQEARLDISNGEFNSPAVIKFLAQLYDNEALWDDTSLTGGNALIEWPWNAGKKEEAFVRNISNKLGLPEQLLRDYYRRRQ